MRVLEVSDGEGAAAFCAKLFARWGHEVIKVESPEREPPKPAFDLYLNGGKRRVAADFRRQDGRATIEALAERCDVLVTDARPRDVRDHRLLELGGASGVPVRLSITPYGLTGPYADFEATSASLMAMGGYTFLMGDPGVAPMTMPGQYPAYQSGAYGYVAALAAALRARREPDLEPTTIDVSQLEVLASLHQSTFTKWVERGMVRGRNGNRMDSAPNSMLPAGDGWVGVSFQQQFWVSFAHMIGRPDIAEDHPLATNAGRMTHYDELAAIVTEAFKARNVQEIFSEAQSTWRVPIGKLTPLGELLDDPHLRERGFWRPIEGEGAYDTSSLVAPASPFRFIGEPYPAERVPVAPGSDTEAVLAEVAKRPAASATPRTRPATKPARPLEGVRVLDLTRIWSGPIAGRILGDLGAHVVKIEALLGRGPAHVPDGTTGYLEAETEVRRTQPWNMQSVFNQLHRNREALCVDLKTEAGRDLFLRLVAVSDVVLENFSARAMSRLGLGYDVMRQANPRLIYVPMPAFGRSGPYRDYIGLGTSIEPMASLPVVMGYAGGPPHSASIAIPDPIAGVGAAAAVLTALERRERTGEGAELDFSQHEGAVGVIGEYFLDRQLTGHEPERVGNGHADCSPHGVYRCAGDDEWIALAARDESEWRALCRIAGCGWERDPRFATLADRLANRRAVDEAIEAWTVTQDKLPLARTLLEAGLPASGVLTAPEVLGDPHLQARGYVAELLHPVTGRQTFDGSPLVFNGDRGYQDWLPPPTLGEHNASILTGLLHLAEHDVTSLQAAGVIADRPPQD